MVVVAVKVKTSFAPFYYLKGLSLLLVFLFVSGFNWITTWIRTDD